MKLLFVPRDSLKEDGGGREEELLNSIVCNNNIVGEILRAIYVYQRPMTVSWYVSDLYYYKLLKLIEVKL